jgi:PAS domain S-box-containing protein
MSDKNILIADDEQGILDLLKEILQNEGHRVFLASNGEKAVELAQKHPIDVAILDKKMPQMDGIEALKQIKDIDQSIEVLIITAYEDLESFNEATVIGRAFDYLLKPFHREEIIRSIQNALNKRDLIQKKNFLNQEPKKRILDLEKDFEKRTSQLRESQIQYKEIIENANDVILVAQDGKLKFVNPKGLELTGYTQEEILKIPFVDLIHAEDRSMVVERHMRRLQDEDLPNTYSFRVLKKNGEFFWVEINAKKTMWEGRPATLNFIRDISDRKRVEEALKASEKKYSSLVENSPDIIYVLDHEGNFTFVGGAIKNLLEFTPEDLMEKHFTSIISPEDVEKARWHFNERRTGKRATRMLELRLKTKQQKGKPFDIRDLVVELDAFGIYDKAVSEKDKKFIGTYGVARDISRRKHVEEVLRESEEKYRMLVENANDAIFIFQDEVVKFPNPKTEELLGYPAKDLSNIPFVNFIHPEDRKMVLKRSLRPIGGEELPGTYSFRIKNRLNEELWVQINAVYISWEGKQATLNFIRDITQERKLEAQFQQAQKMEAIGTLAGGIAHDFNNLLTGIQGNAYLMLMDMDSSHPHFKYLKAIEDQVKNAAELTSQLLGFARGGKYEVTPTNLNELIKKNSRMFGRTKKEIRIHRRYQKDIWAVEVDQGQIEQVLLNLYVNAWQAMPGGGDLYLKTENFTIDENYSNLYYVEPGNYVKISITDTGFGMDDATKQRIFEPFFTTKEMGRGTGLGLASAYGIIKNHGGIINVYSEIDKGTTFNIYLPASEKEVIEYKEIPGEVLKGTETILFVDDEDMVIDIGEKILKDWGYTVLLARSGNEAIEIYEKNKDKIDLVILDMIMPDISGGETYDRMKEINPQIKVLLSSGYSINGQAKEILKRGCNGFIQKPLNLKPLSQKIREILNKQ